MAIFTKTKLRATEEWSMTKPKDFMKATSKTVSSMAKGLTPMRMGLTCKAIGSLANRVAKESCAKSMEM